MRNINLSESDCMFIHYALKQYASLNINNLDKDDKQEIYEVANKFK